MTHPIQTEVLIVGAGPTGLMLACELARRDVPFRLIDAAPQPWNASRGKGLQPRSLELLDDLGVVDRVLEGGRFHLPLRFHDTDGGHEDRNLYENQEPSPQVPYGSPLMIPQWRIEGILRDRLAEWGGRIEFGTALENLAQDDAGVTTTLSRNGVTETAQTRWLVACDGGRSTARRLLDIAFLGETLETHRMFVGDVRVSGIDRDFWHAWRSKEGFVGLAPLPHTDAFQFQASLTMDMSTEPSLEVFQQILETRSGRSDIRLINASWMSYWRANVRMVDRYRVGRAFIAGDAAHVHTPAGGQGMNTGLQDAYNLGWKLAAVIRGADAALLDSYEEERLPVAASVLGLSSKLLERAVNAKHLVPKRGAETFQLDIHYRDSRLAQELRASPGQICAGDRAPDAPGLRKGDQVCRLFDLFRGTHFTVLAFGDGWESCLADIEARHGRLVKCVTIGESGWLDSEGHAVRGYDIQSDTLLLIRPDGYIGFAINDKAPAAVDAYLRLINP
ncbi:FAD-dependent oxidoreductase [Dyella caseinilytica]|uniref:Alkyl hydroperoxide reductase subunit F n=1 Tax=Dyella caseinilytica TaxID=1849581 RepID=A0ABX7GTM8_9GAMM|nr:FAD-dependent oxidoreductase [Dyella caseinilytica]QRN53809.1 FAD-dependent oxidoreductase [Dyella caseinilytica]GFZ89347.1 3-(3-hydroxyphenyl)propionate hydroxylase [Dyella caseinilytica]